jgi:SM-20-related protein
MLNLAIVPTEYLRPFRHLEVPGILDRNAACALREAFPRTALTIRRAGTDKSYIVANKRILEVDGTRRTGSKPWNRFLDAVISPDYRSYLAEVSGTSLSDALVEVDLNAYAVAGYMSPHTDRPEKLLSHIIYLSPYWREEWGGQLALLESAEARAARTVTPRWPYSILLPRSDHSWHSVISVAPDARRRRLTIQISFWACPPPAVARGRITTSAPPRAGDKRLFATGTTRSDVKNVTKNGSRPHV